MVAKEKEYLFSKEHGDRLENTLLNRSFAFNFHSSESYLMLETTGIKEAGEVTKITLCNDLLPEHCKLALVEDALAGLEMFPNNVQLLKVLGDYVENSYSEQRGYFFMNGVTWGLLIACMIAEIPLILFIATSVLVISNLFYDHYLEKKLGKWIGNLIEGDQLAPANRAKLEANLITLIGNCKTAENIGEAAYKEIQLATTSPSAPVYPSFFPNYPDRATERQGLINYTYDSASGCPVDIYHRSG